MNDNYLLADKSLESYEREDCQILEERPTLVEEDWQELLEADAYNEQLWWEEHYG